MEHNKGYAEAEMPPELWAAQKAVQNLRQRLIERRDERRKRLPVPEILYHYTDLRGLHGMFSSLKMWLSDAAYMNDPLEGTWVHQRACAALHILGDSTLSEQTLAQIKAHLAAPDLWDETLRTAEDVGPLRFAALHDAFMPAFIASFTEEGDRLSQWRGYGAGGDGVAIGFDLTKLDLSIVESAFEDQSHPPALIKVEYDPEIQDEEVMWIFKNAKSVFDDHESILSTNEHTKRRLPQLFHDVIRDALYWLRWEFKSPHYSEEKEWRLVSNPMGFRHLTRVSNGHIVPYVEMPLPQTSDRPLNQLAIPEIVLGPRCPPSAVRSIRGLLQNLAYPKVVRSKLALR